MSSLRFSHRTILVTGASSGIGLATARRLREEGAQIVSVARDIGRLLAASGTEGAGVVNEVADMADETQVKALADRLRSRGTVLHGLVHCAGEHALRPLKLLGAAEIQRMCSSHIVSSILVCRYLVGNRVLADGSSIVLMASAAALRGASGSIAYSAAKAGVIAAARSLAVELSPKRIRVNTVSPGVVRTPQSDAFLQALPMEQRAAIEREHPLGLGRPEDVAGLLAFLLSDDARWITGTNLLIDGGLTLN